MDISLTGTWKDVLIVFFSGVLVSFTPCVYPVMPLTATFIAGANVHGSRQRALLISLIYVGGMACIYAVLAIIAALTGKIFGQIQNTSLFYFVTAILLLFFSFSMLDFIQLPTLNGQLAVRRDKPKSLLEVFLFGMTSGLIVGPCTAPVLGSLLWMISRQQSGWWWGIVLMFVFAYGIGFSLILIGTFSGLLAKLPKSGQWLIWVKRISAMILLVMALFFVYKGINAIH